MSYERMGKRAEELEAEVAAWMDAAAKADASEDAAFGRDKSGEEMPAWVGDKSGGPRRSAQPRPNWRPRREPPPKPSAKRGPRRRRSGRPKAARNL